MADTLVEKLNENAKGKRKGKNVSFEDRDDSKNLTYLASGTSDELSDMSTDELEELND